MATVYQVQDLAFDYQRGVTSALIAIDELKRLKSYYVDLNLADNNAFPEDAFAGTALAPTVDRDMFREIVSICDGIIASIAAPGVRAVLLNIVDGIPSE